MTFVQRRARNLSITVLLALTMLAAAWLHQLALGDVSEVSGWTLFAAIVVVALYNSRKKLPFLPLLDGATWLQLHVYLGALTIVGFLIHTGFRLPSGTIDTALWLLFATVAASGLVGLLISRLVPARLGRRGERVLFERIPALRVRLASEVEGLAERSVTELSSSTIADYYARRLQPFFGGVRNQPAHLVGYNRPLQTMRREIAGIRRYLNEPGRHILDEIETRVIAKDDLDYQSTWQLVLKGWLFVHIPLTYGLLLVIVVHILLAYGFAMGRL